MTAKAPRHCPGTHCDVCKDFGFVASWLLGWKICPHCHGDCAAKIHVQAATEAPPQPEKVQVPQGNPDKPTIRTLLKGDEQVYQKWCRAALADDTVWPYIGTGTSFEFPDLPENNWYSTLLMDTTETAVLRMLNDRSHNNLNCAIWALNNQYRESAVASLLALVPSYCRRYDKAWITGGCHVSNTASLKMHRKIFGEPAGIFVQSRWNALEGRWEDGYDFRARIEEVMKRYNPAQDH